MMHNERHLSLTVKCITVFRGEVSFLKYYIPICFTCSTATVIPKTLNCCGSSHFAWADIKLRLIVHLKEKQ